MASGGFAKYRCKYFATHNCDKWVWFPSTPCAYCVAAGRDELDLPGMQSFVRPREVCLPVVHQGAITYTIMDLDQKGQPGNYQALRYKTTQQQFMPPITTSDTPGVALALAGMAPHPGYHH